MAARPGSRRGAGWVRGLGVLEKETKSPGTEQDQATRGILHSMRPPILVRYQGTPAVISEALDELQKSLGGTSLRVAIIFLGICLTSMVAFILSSGGTKWVSNPVHFTVSTIASTIVALLIWRSSVPKTSGDPTTIPEMTYRFSDIGVEKQSNDTESRMDWRAFAEFRESKGYFFLCYPKAHPGAITLAEIFPKAAFQSSDEVDTFRALLESKLQRGKQGPRIRPIEWVMWVFIVLLVLSLFTVVVSRRWH